MIATSILEPGVPDVEFYAPRFRVSVGGRSVNEEVLGDVLQVKVTMQKNGLSDFSMTLNNWDENVADFPKFKYSDSDAFNIGTELRIEMGYAEQLSPLITGQVTSLTPTFPESGTPTVAVSGKNTLFRLKGSKPKAGDRLIYTDMADWQIAQEVAGRHRIPIEVTREGPVHKQVIHKKDQDEAAFLLDRAEKIEFDLFMQPDRDTGKDTLFFVKPNDGRDGRPVTVFHFAWGRDLIQFSPKLSAVDQVSSVTVRGWDPATKQPIQYTATARDLPSTSGSGANGPSSASSVSPRGKEDVVVDASVLSEEEARRLAVSRLVQLAYTYKTGSGKVIGQPKMRPGDNVTLEGLGKRFSGMWHITKVDHTLGSSGYQTSFEVESLRETDR